MDIDEIFANSVDRTKSHLRQKRDPGLNRMQVELTDLAVLRNKELEKTDGFIAFPLQEIIDGVVTAGVRLVLVEEFAITL